MAPLVVMQDLCYRYAGGTSVAYAGTLEVAAGERVVILGANGTGKSTLLHLYAGLLAPSAGSLRVFGLEPARHFYQVRDRLALLMQHVEDQLIAPTVYEDVAFTPHNRDWPEPEVHEAVMRTLASLGLTPLADRLTHELSGGERVKVAIAGCLVTRPEMLLLDEPFEHLDAGTCEEVVSLINALAAEGRAIVTVTHRVDLAPRVADRVVVLAPGGRLAIVGTPAEVFAQPAAMRALHLEPPPLAELAIRLGFEGCLPATVDEAVRLLVAHLEHSPDACQ